MKVKPMLGEFALDDIEYIESSESRALVEHRVPGLAGNYLQDTGTIPNIIWIEGSKAGDEARDNFLTGIRKIFNDGQPTSFVADINTATEITDVLIEELEVMEFAGSESSFRYVLKLRKYVKPPEPPSNLDAGILSDALAAVDVFNLLDAFVSIPDIGDPSKPLSGAFDQVRAGKVDQALGGQSNLVDQQILNPSVSPGPESAPSVTDGAEPRLDPADPRIDGATGPAIQGMLDTPETAPAAARLVESLNEQKLGGIFGEDSEQAAQLAAAHGKEVSQLIPSPLDAVLVLDPAAPLEVPPTVVLRNAVLEDPARLNTALDEVGQTLDLFERSELALCDGTASSSAVPNLVPSTFCRVLAREVVEQKPTTRGLVGMFFEHDKTFLLPSAMRSIRLLNDFYKSKPGGELLVVGHTDTTGPQDYNLELSKRRAENVAAYLTDTVETWTSYYQPQPISKQWGTREDQHMLSVLPEGREPFYTDPVDGIPGPSTTEAVTEFQEFSNADRGTSLQVDGIAGPNTRRELVKAYMELDGTSLPEGTPLFSQGCGEFHPEVPTGDEVNEPQNRRTEMFFFPDKIEPPMPAGGCKAPGCIEYPQWRSRATRTIDFTNATILLVEADWEV